MNLEKLGIFEKNLIYENPFLCEKDIENFVLEGEASISFDNCMCIASTHSPKEGQKANYVLWCKETFPANLAITWKFKPLNEPALAMMFFSAKAADQSDLFSNHLKSRNGVYDCYHHGDINAYHVSYFRRKEPDERAFHTCNLRKSYGLHLVAQGGDPIPEISAINEFYELAVVKIENNITFFINGLLIFEFVDDGKTFGSVLQDGKIGLRQLAPTIAQYKDLKVYDIFKGNQGVENEKFHL